MTQTIYLDHAATTRTAPTVVAAMLPYFTEHYGNASSAYALGSESRMAMVRAREGIAATLGVDSSEIFFTSGGSEADNWAVKSVFEARQDRGRHIVTTRIEHHAILRACEHLARQGAEITYLDVDRDGLVDPQALENAIRPDTTLVSVMAANNEIGTLQPLGELCGIAHAHGALFHTDAVQVYGHLPLHAKELGVDLLSASGHKFCGPKGVGFLYVSRHLKLPSLIDGGGQERGRRAGTENLPCIVGMGAAAALAHEAMAARAEHVRALRDHLIARVEAEIDGAVLLGHRTKRLPGNASFFLGDGIMARRVLEKLDERGICASDGSACSTGSPRPSHVLTAIGLTEQEARCAIRMTLGEDNSLEELDFAADALAEIVKELRG